MRTSLSNRGLWSMPMMAAALCFSGSGSVWAVECSVAFLGPDGVALPKEYRPDPGAVTFLVVHGFNDRGTGDGSRRQARAIQSRLPEANVVIVDWHLPAEKDGGRTCLWSGFWSFCDGYARAAAAAPAIGRQIAEWMKSNHLSPGRTVICGHSLGAQVAAFAGNAVQDPDVFGEPVRAIIAADPAGPLFSGRPEAKRLDRSDARRVIVVHATKGLGDFDPIGAVDLYVRWPESDTDTIGQHRRARHLVTEAFCLLAERRPGPFSVASGSAAPLPDGPGETACDPAQARELLAATFASEGIIPQPMGTNRPAQVAVVDRAAESTFGSGPQEPLP